MKLKYWLSSKRKLIAQLQEARDDRDYTKEVMAEVTDMNRSLARQLRRLSRERFQERELRLAAEELRDEYLEQLENEEE